MVSSGDSSTTQPYVEDEWEQQQLMDSGCSTSGNKANAAEFLQQSDGVLLSPVVCQTPSPFHPHRANFQANAAAAAVHSREPCAAPAGTSQAHPGVQSVAFPRLVSNSLDCLQIEHRFEDPLTAGKNIKFRRTATPESGFRGGGNLSYSEQAGLCSPSLTTRHSANENATPVITPWEGRTAENPTLGTGREHLCNETEHTWRRTPSRELFPGSNPEKVRKISPRDVVQNVLEIDRPAIQYKRFGVETEGATTTFLPSPPKVQSCEIARASEGNCGHPISKSQIVIRKEGTYEQYKHIFGDQQPIPWPVITEHLQAIGSLDFSTAFRVLEWLKGKTLDTLNVEVIKRMKTLPKADVKTYLSHVDGLQNRRKPDIREMLGQKSCTENLRFECCVNHTGGLLFKTSEQREGLTALQRCFGPDRVLRVFFADGPGSKTVCSKIMQEGIIVGLRHYQYWTHKDTGKDFEKKKKPVDREFWSSTHCFFVCTSSQAISDKSDPKFKQFGTIREARCKMMHIHTTPNIPKYISRLQLALSQTLPIDLDFSTIRVKFTPDIHCKDERGRETICTDGTGYISVDLAKEIAINLKRGKTDPEKMFRAQEYPSIIQIRLFHNGSAYKGTLLAHNKLEEPRTIVLRKSMQKVEFDPKLSNFRSFDSLEICGYSKPPREAYLSRELIMLLTLGGVPGSFFLELVDEQIQKVRCLMIDPIAAIHAIRDFTSEKAEMAQRMLLAGIPPKESFLQKTIMELRKDLLQDFRKGRVFLPDSCSLYGTADPTGTLKPNQVAIILGFGLVSWPKVAVYKHPGKHPGDIHIFEAIANKEVQDIVGSGKYVIFFSTQGSRSVPDEIANSDLDGDQYFITWNTMLLADFVENDTRWFPKAEARHEQPIDRLMDLSLQQLEDSLIEKFINARFNPSGDVGIISNWWLAHMDQFLFLREDNKYQSALHHKKALDLVEVFYDLVDSEKTGKKVNIDKGQLRPRKSPHFQEKGQKDQTTFVKDQNFGYGVYVNNSYKSTTILGEVHDKAVNAEKSWKFWFHEEIDFEPAFHINEIKGNNIPVPELIGKWKKLFASYNQETKAHSKATEHSDFTVIDAGHSSIILKYKEILYGADSQDIFANASAIYAVVFDAVNSRTPRKDNGGDRVDAVNSKTPRKSDGGDLAPSFRFAWMVAGRALCEMYEKYHRPQGRNRLTVAMQIYGILVGKVHSSDVIEKYISPCQEDWDV